MPKHSVILVFAASFGTCGCALATDEADCRAADGTFLTGIVVGAPTYVAGRSMRGINLSHTHIVLKGDADAKIYNIAADNVFSDGYVPSDPKIPSPLTLVNDGAHLELCGIPYSGGIHWVHTNCGAVPTPQDPEGWIKLIDQEGRVGPNLAGSQKYCYLWPRR